MVFDRGYGRIVLDQRIGEGGMGIVFRGWLFRAPDTLRGSDPPQLVALKILRSHVHARELTRKLFVAEAEALGGLDHPNIVRFFEIFEDGPWLVLMLEYIDGDTVEDIIARHIARAQMAGPGALPGMAFRRAWHYFEQLLGALAATHALGIVHRDVKPANVLVRRDGIVKLTDYGIAHMDAAPNDELDARAPGTGAYMAPEQVLGREIDSRTDLYSAAIVLYEMLTGRTPFGSRDQSEFVLRREQVETPPAPIRTYLYQAPPVLDALFHRALAKDPELRFASAVEMGTAFREALGLPETPEWLVQAEFAARVAAEDQSTVEPVPLADAVDLQAPAAPQPFAAPVIAIGEPKIESGERPSGTLALGLPPGDPGKRRMTRRMGTLRDFLARQYRTRAMDIPGVSTGGHG